MTKEIRPLTWQVDLKDEIDLEMQSIDSDFMVFDNVQILPAFNYPFRTDVTAFIINTKGTSRGVMGLKRYETTAPCMITLLAGEILQHEHVSDDFEGLFIVMSKQMTDALFPNAHERMPLAFSVRQNPSIGLDEENLNLLTTYFNMLKTVVGMTDNPNRKAIVQHLMLAFYYHSNSWLRKMPQDEQARRKQDELVDRFLLLIEKHYKKERQVGFYADKLSITPKYLSQLVKANTGKSANDWIDDYVMLEAKVLLKSTKLTIQQISDELHFADQSVFGKYFKRLEGVGPKVYRRD